MHPEAVRDEPMIREVEGPKDAMKRMSCSKGPDAVWVPGLEPEVAYYRGHSGRNDDDDDDKHAGGMWMKWSFYLGIMAVTLMGVQLIFQASMLGLAFPEREVHAWPIIRQMSTFDHFLDTMPSVMAMAFASALCIQLGAVSQSFMCFMGVGVSTLTALAAVGDKILLYRACTLPHLPPTECDLPLVLHYICNTIKVMAPAVAVFMSSGIWDLLVLYKQSKGAEFGAPSFFSMKSWGWILIAPVLLHLHHVVHMIYYGEPSQKILSTAIGVQVLIWTFLLFVKVRVQKRFEVRSFDPKKTE